MHHLLGQGIKPDLILRKQSNTWRIKDVLSKVSLHYVDLRDKKKLERVVSEVKPNIIYHCATYGGYPWQTDSEIILETDIKGTVNLLDAARKVDFDLFINTGTSSEYGAKEKPMRESDLLKPLTDYGVSKAAATLYCQAVAKRENLPIVTLRLFSAYGYFEEAKRLVPWVALLSLKAKNPTLSRPESVRDFIFIEDVLNAYIKATECKAKLKGEIINIGSGIQHTIADMVDKIISFVDKKLKPEWNTIPNPRIEPNCWVADISRAGELMNWKPEYSFEQGVERTVDWFRKNQGLYQL